MDPEGIEEGNMILDGYIELERKERQEAAAKETICGCWAKKRS
jgi:hypothetical protein